MDAEETRAIFKFSAHEKNIISSFGVQEELFLPFLLYLNQEAPGATPPRRQRVLQ